VCGDRGNGVRVCVVTEGMEEGVCGDRGNGVRVCVCGGGGGGGGCILGLGGWGKKKSLGENLR